MKHPDLAHFESKFLRKNPLPEFRAGDTVSVMVKIAEGTNKDGSAKFRLQAFEGTVIRYRKGTTNSTFMVRKISAGGIGVDRTFFAHSPLIDRVDVKARGKVRKSRIYYIKKLKGKAARISSRFLGGAPSAD
jgi:large subunit ribosomal protein L19